jgi:hypothetical protein
MSTVSRGLPANPHLDIPKKQSRALLKLCRESSIDALHRIRRQHPKFYHTENETLVKNLKPSAMHNLSLWYRSHYIFSFEVR